jgi:hypothetical protein
VGEWVRVDYRTAVHTRFRMQSTIGLPLYNLAPEQFPSSGPLSPSVCAAGLLSCWGCRGRTAQDQISFPRVTNIAAWMAVSMAVCIL